MAILNISTPLYYRNIRLELLGEQHLDGLIQSTSDGELWQYHYAGAPEPKHTLDYIKTALNTSHRIAFAVIHQTHQQVIGTTSYYNIEPDIQRLEIGYTWYAQRYWRTDVNTTCKYVLLHYAFDVLNYQAVGWRTDALNIRSQQAIERLGATKDGVLRHFQARRDGSVRDTVMYSMLKQEWQNTHQVRLLNILHHQG